VRIIRSAQTIAPFGDRVCDLPFLDVSFEQFRQREVQQARVEPNDLCFASWAFASAEILEAFRRQTTPGTPSRLSLPVSHVSRIFQPLSSVLRKDDQLLYDIFIYADQNASLEELRHTCAPVCVETESKTKLRQLPRMNSGPSEIEYPVDGRLAVHLEHWVHLLWAIPCLVPGLLKNARNRVGRNVTIHPTAYLENAVIGDNTQIGAGCFISNSYIGPGSQLFDFTKVRHSVLGHGTHTLADASFSHVVSFGGATLSNLLLRDVILGRNCFVTTGVIFQDQSIDKPISVLDGGKEISTERMALGGCAGHGCILGARAIIAPGRALPNRTTIVMRREEGVHKISPELARTPVCWNEGTLSPAAEMLSEGGIDEFEDDRRRYTRDNIPQRYE